MAWLNLIGFCAVIIVCCLAIIPLFQRGINKTVCIRNFENSILILEKKYSTCILIFLMLVAVGVRLWKFGIVPAGFNQDGALGAIDAFSLVQYGTDHFGMRFPVHFTAWGFGQMSVLLSYLSTPFIALFGFNRITARIAVLIVSLLAIWVLYKLCDIAFDRKAAIVVLAFCAINPWQIMQSRWALDCNIFPHFFLFSVYFLYLAFTKKRFYLYISMLLFGITMYSYGIAWYAVPLFLCVCSIYLVLNNRLKLKEVIISAFAYLLISWPIFAVIIVNYLKLPPIETPFFTIPLFPDTVRTSDILFFSQNALTQFINNLIALFRVVFLQTTDLPWNTIPEYGTIYLISIPFAVIGLFSILRMKKAADNDGLQNIIIIWAAVAVISGIIINNVNVNRMNIIFYTMIILCGIGIYTVIRNIKVMGILISVTYLAVFIGFTSSYFGPHAKILGDCFYAGFGEALEYVEALDYDRIYVTNWTQSENSWWVSEPLTLFYNHVDAKYFQGKAEARSKSGKLLLPYKVRYKYVSFKDKKITPNENAAYIANKQEIQYFNNTQFRLIEYSNYYAVIPRSAKSLSNTPESGTNGNLVLNPGFENNTGDVADESIKS